MKTQSSFKRIEDTTSHVLAKEPVSTIIDANRIAVDKGELLDIPEPDELLNPEFSIITENEWNALETGRDSKYEKYDTMQVGQSVMNLPTRIANTICSRLRKKGFDMQTRKVANGVLAIRRVA